MQTINYSGNIDGCTIFINNQQESLKDYARFTEKNPLNMWRQKIHLPDVSPFYEARIGYPMFKTVVKSSDNAV
ncbi:Uncharacterised protein [Serratia fonticola]|uniref:Uncharacterized protein n=1 Tax=Serratia fonticola TaxID=47917 RepID=A0A4V6KLX7_SERFO|nr:Uncharacterised protein [Serratia fonticola]